MHYRMVGFIWLLVAFVIAVAASSQSGPQPICAQKGPGESCCAHFASRTIWCPVAQTWCAYQMASDATIHLGDWGSTGYSPPLAQDPVKHYCTYYAAVCPKSSSGACSTAYPVQSKFACGSLVEPPTPPDCGVNP